MVVGRRSLHVLRSRLRSLSWVVVSQVLVSRVGNLAHCVEGVICKHGSEVLKEVGGTL